MYACTKNKYKSMKKYLLIVLVAMTAVGCNQRELNTRVSNTTGWNYFDQKTTNFQANEGVGNVNPVGMVPIQGGSFTVGEKDEFLTAPRNNETRTLTVSSFYMDKYEVTNLNWNEYLHWLDFVFGAVAPELVNQARRIIPFGVRHWLTTIRMRTTISITRHSRSIRL